MHDKLKEKLGVDLKKYKMLGMCNPGHAYKSLQVEENIGLFLPCKVLIKEINKDTSEIVVINTETVMSMLNNEKLNDVGKTVASELNTALDAINE